MPCKNFRTILTGGQADSVSTKKIKHGVLRHDSGKLALRGKVTELELFTINQ